MKKTFKRILVLLAGGAVFVGVPLLFNSPLVLFISWLPALFVVIYLDQGIDP